VRADTNHSMPDKHGSFANALEGMLAKFAQDLQVPLVSRDLQVLPLSFKDLKNLSDHPKDPIEARKWLTTSVLANPDITRFRQMTLAALEALDYGETQPMFRATKEGRKVKWTILQLQLRAIAFVKYREERGTKKYKALEEVAEAFGVTDNAIRAWESRLRNEFGNVEFTKRLAHAEKDIEESNPQQSLLEFAQLYKLEKKRAKGRSQK
jgi:transcriptional regulator with XRE-family HTH domain